MYVTFELSCSVPNCGGKRKTEQALSAGWALGDLIPPDPGDPERARCPRCKRHQMKVTYVPEKPVSSTPTGFTRLPEE